MAGSARITAQRAVHAGAAPSVVLVVVIEVIVDVHLQAGVPFIRRHTRTGCNGRIPISGYCVAAQRKVVSSIVGREVRMEHPSSNRRDNIGFVLNPVQELYMSPDL